MQYFVYYFNYVDGLTCIYVLHEIYIKFDFIIEIQCAYDIKSKRRKKKEESAFYDI